MCDVVWGEDLVLKLLLLKLVQLLLKLLLQLVNDFLVHRPQLVQIISSLRHLLFYLVFLLLQLILQQIHVKLHLLVLLGERGHLYLGLFMFGLFLYEQP